MKHPGYVPHAELHALDVQMTGLRPQTIDGLGLIAIKSGFQLECDPIDELLSYHDVDRETRAAVIDNFVTPNIMATRLDIRTLDKVSYGVPVKELARGVLRFMNTNVEDSASLALTLSRCPDDSAYDMVKVHLNIPKSEWSITEKRVNLPRANLMSEEMVKPTHRYYRVLAVVHTVNDLLLNMSRSEL